jgi:3-deoxy-manno-octulosonate cytidylyltransferase (CMP-KDO synthetase)
MNPVTCIVPARMASSRFPGKPLVDIGGMPLVVRSARRAIAASCFAKVVVATEDQAIVDTCAAYGLESLLTPPFPTGTDRVAWAAGKLDAAWVINLQGDEPVFPLDLLRNLCDLLATDPSALWTAADIGLTEADRIDDDVVKIELGNGDPADAIDFFRELPPDARSRNFAIHVGVYGGSLKALTRFASLSVPRIERDRRIEPLRALAAGMPVRARKGTWPRAAIDRKEHISTVLRMLEGVT